jgi:hypothetical protein
MKAILIVDKPECCLDCPCSYTYGYHEGDPTDDICEVTEYRLTKENMNERIPTWCPLKPMPEKKELNEFKYRMLVNGEQFFYKDIGWNKCIDEILGEEE